MKDSRQRVLETDADRPAKPEELWLTPEALHKPISRASPSGVPEDALRPTRSQGRTPSRTSSPSRRPPPASSLRPWVAWVRWASSSGRRASNSRIENWADFLAGKAPVRPRRSLRAASLRIPVRRSRPSSAQPEAFAKSTNIGTSTTSRSGMPSCTLTGVIRGSCTWTPRTSSAHLQERGRLSCPTPTSTSSSSDDNAPLHARTRQLGKEEDAEQVRDTASSCTSMRCARPAESSPSTSATEAFCEGFAFDETPGGRHRRRPQRHDDGQDDGPPCLRRRGLRQDRSRAALRQPSRRAGRWPCSARRQVLFSQRQKVVLTLAIRVIVRPTSFSYVLLRLTQRHRQLSSAPVRP